MRGIEGASLIEVALALAIALILSFGFGTAVTSAVEAAREEAVLNQLDRIKKGIVGEPRVIPPGEKNLLRFGYVGDMGKLPASLDDLLASGAQPNYSIDVLLQLGAGWRGPYIPSGLRDLTKDPWGNGLVLSAAAGTSTLTGAPIVAAIRSLGPDGQSGTSDDAVVEIYKGEAFSKVIGYVKDASSATVAGVTVKLSFSSSGTIATVSTITDSEGRYQFDDVPFGDRVFQIEPKLTYQRDTALTSGGALNNVEFVVVNLGKDATTVTSFTATYTSDPPASYSQVFINGVQVPNASGGSGTTISFAAKTVSGTGVVQEPAHVQISALVSQVPDALLGAIGTGGTLKIQLNNFKDSGGANVDMTGVTFEVDFSDGSKTLFTTKRK